MSEDVRINISANDQTKNGIDSANAKLKGLSKTADDMKANGKKLTLMWTELNSAFGVARQVVEAAKQAYQEIIGTTIDYANQVRELSTLLGVSAEDTSRIIQATDDLGISYQTLNSALQAAARQGIDVSIDGLKRLADQYAGITDKADRAQFVLKTFGRSGAEMAYLLEKGADGIQEMTDAISDGLIMTEENIKATRQYEIAVDNLNDSFTALKMSLGKELIPYMSRWLMVLNEVIAPSKGWAEQIDLTVEGIKKLTTGMPFKEVIANWWEWNTAIISGKTYIDSATTSYMGMAQAQAEAQAEMDAFTQAAIEMGEGIENTELRQFGQIARNAQGHFENLATAVQAVQTAEENLHAAQEAWEENTANDIASQLEEAYQSGQITLQEYTLAMQALDREWETGLVAQMQYEEGIRALVDHYAKYHDIDSFTTGIRNLKDGFMDSNPEVKEAADELERVVTFQNSLMDKSAVYTIDVLWNHHGQPVDIGGPDITPPAGPTPPYVPPSPTGPPSPSETFTGGAGGGVIVNVYTNDPLLIAQQVITILNQQIYTSSSVGR